MSGTAVDRLTRSIYLLQATAARLTIHADQIGDYAAVAPIIADLDALTCAIRRDVDEIRADDTAARLSGLTARRIRAIIADRGLTLPAVAADIGSPELEQHLDVHGRRAVTMDELAALGDVLGVPVPVMLGVTP